MAFRLKNKGMEIYLDITHYPKDDGNEWCKVDYNFKSRDDINVVRKSVEAFLGSEILEIEQFLTEYLDFNLEDGAYYECVEPGFSFRVDYDIVMEVEISHIFLILFQA